MKKSILQTAMLSLIALTSLSCKGERKELTEYFVGTNFWYGALIEEDRLCKELDSLKSIGITNLRVLVGADGLDGAEVKVQPALQKAPGVYNQKVLDGLDRLLEEMERRQMKAVLYINNSWEWSGGYGSYLEWAGNGPIPNTRTDGYGKFQDYVANFVSCESAKELFFNHVRYIVGRYKNSNAIFSWQIGNEPRCFSPEPAVQDAFVDYIFKSAALIKSIDSTHMVSIGNEGMCGCEGSYELFERINSCPDVDYITIHIWPYNWGWAREQHIAEDLRNAIERTDDYINRHLEIADKLNKKVVIEEFGYPRDGFEFRKGTPVTGRDGYYAHIFSRVEESAKTGGTLLGANFWGWGGLAEQNPDNIYWQPGDDYCGDPAQEQQGLNSVYMCDRSTADMIREFNRRLKK